MLDGSCQLLYNVDSMSTILDIMTNILYIDFTSEIAMGIMKTNLRKFRFLRGELSQQQLADLVGISRQTVVSIEKGNYAPSVKLALLLASTLKTTVEELFKLEDKDYA